ncbi:MAG: methyl-accepting chemotaxis protein [Burkholderiaceae bacterium]
MNGVSHEITAANEDLAKRTESQAASLQQTAAAMEEMTGTVGQSAKSAREAAELANQAKTIADQSGQEVILVARNMESISEASEKIGDIIQVIESIAFQTNILALNAAVEAARAGEEGRGFAVVAIEVRELAKRTSDASKEVKQLVAASAQRVQEGGLQTESAKRAMQNAQASVGQVSSLISDISASADELQLGISQINQAIAQMDSMTQQNAALVEENAANALQVETISEGALEAVGIFTLNENDKLKPLPDAVDLRRAGKATKH